MIIHRFLIQLKPNIKIKVGLSNAVLEIGILLMYNFFKIEKSPLTLIAQPLEKNLLLKYFTKFAFKNSNNILIKN